MITRPLPAPTGVRVVESAPNIASPLASEILATLGAGVLKIERLEVVGVPVPGTTKTKTKAKTKAKTKIKIKEGS